MGQSLSWGRRYLMCPPDHFRVAYAINPWMDPGCPVDVERATAQWHALVGTLRAAGAEISTLAPDPALPDMVFTANAGLVDGGTFVPARMHHTERGAEPDRASAWFADAGFGVVPLPEGVVLEGLGDALPFGDALVVGWSARSSRNAPAAVAERFGRPVVPLRLTDPRFYHADLVFCPLDDHRAIVAPHSLGSTDITVLNGLVPEAVWLEPHEAAAFVANSVVVDRAVIMPVCPPRVGRQLEAWGFTPVEVDVSEFHAAGGSVRCLTLALDTELSRPRPSPQRATTTAATVPAPTAVAAA